MYRTGVELILDVKFADDLNCTLYKIIVVLIS